MPSAPEPLHLLIADATPALPAGATAPALPPLPRLDALLARLQRADTLTCDDDAPDTPFERALARAHGLPGAPGQVPWAAFDSGSVGRSMSTETSVPSGASRMRSAGIGRISP